MYDLTSCAFNLFHLADFGLRGGKSPGIISLREKKKDFRKLLESLILAKKKQNRELNQIFKRGGVSA